MSTAEPAFFRHRFGFFRQDRGVSLFEGSFTRSRVKFCDFAMILPAASPFSAAEISLPETHKRDGVDLFLFLVGLVFVGFEIRRNKSFRQRLRPFGSRQRAASEKRKVLHGLAF
jgi:hypothetical protein